MRREGVVFSSSARDDRANHWGRVGGNAAAAAASAAAPVDVFECFVASLNCIHIFMRAM